MAHQQPHSDRASRGGITVRSEAALTYPATLLALATLLVNDLVFKWLWPGTWINGQAQRPRLDNLRATAYRPPPRLSCPTQPNRPTRRMGNRLHRPPAPLRRLQHLRTAARRDYGRVLFAKRHPRRLAIRSDCFDRHSDRDGYRNPGLAKIENRNQGDADAIGFVDRRDSFGGVGGV